MSRTHPPLAHKPLGQRSLGDFDVITGPPARSRPIPPGSPPKLPLASLNSTVGSPDADAKNKPSP